MFEKTIVIDARGHLLGRLAATVAKELLYGQKIVVCRCEEINISGSLFRNKLKYADFLRKRTNTNPKRGPFHLRSPAKIFWRTVRGMLPHKIQRGALALKRMKVFEGVPPPYDKVKRAVVPSALKVLRLKPGRRVTVLGRLSEEVGWKHGKTVQALEAKRKIKSAAYYQRKKALAKLKTKALATVQPKLAEPNKTLAQYGY